MNTIAFRTTLWSILAAAAVGTAGCSGEPSNEIPSGGAEPPIESAEPAVSAAEEGSLREDGAGEPFERPALGAVPPADYADGSCQGLTPDGWPRDAQGWTQLPAPGSAGGRVIHVSATEPVQRNVGNDYYVPTAGAAFALLRNGEPDMVLFRRGETFALDGSIPANKLSGTSMAKPRVLGAYGTGARPVLATTGKEMINAVSGAINHLAIVSLELTTSRPDKEAVEGIRLNVRTDSSNILIEDTRVRGFQTNIALIPFGGHLRNVVIRRSQILDAYPTKGHSQGLYSSHVEGLVLEENLFDHNGFLSRTPGEPGLATIFNHNAYVQTDNRCLIARRNVFARSASHGLQARPGGVVEENLFLESPLALTWGSVNGGAVTEKLIPLEGVTGRVIGNVVLDGTDITTALPRDGGLSFGNTRWVAVRDNVIARHLRPEAGSGITLETAMGIGVHNAVLENNVMFNLARGLSLWGGAFGAVSIRNDGVNDPIAGYTKDVFTADKVKIIDATSATEMNGGDVFLLGGARVITSGRTGLLFPAGTPAITIQDQGIAVSGNTFSKVDRAPLFLQTFRAGSFAFSANHYDCTNAKPNECATIGSAGPTSVAAGSAQLGEKNATFGAASLVDANRSIGTYLAEKAPGVPQTNLAWLERARMQRRDAYDARYTAAPVVAYVRAGLKKK